MMSGIVEKQVLGDAVNHNEKQVLGDAVNHNVKEDVKVASNAIQVTKDIACKRATLLDLYMSKKPKFESSASLYRNHTTISSMNISSATNASTSKDTTMNAATSNNPTSRNSTSHNLTDSSSVIKIANVNNFGALHAIKLPKKSKGKRKNLLPRGIEQYGVPMNGKWCRAKTINVRLQKLGIDPERVSICVKAAMAKGHIIFNGEATDLERFVIEDEYDDHYFKVFVKDVLYMKDLGMDFGDGAINSPIVCTCCKTEDNKTPQHVYLTHLCTGTPFFDIGRQNNHCTECPAFGKCLGDYRESHCLDCNKHWFEGNSGFPCDHCNPEENKDECSIS